MKREEKNHLYGTFTAAKERVVDGGRKRSAAMCLARAQQAHAVCNSVESSPSGKSRRNRRKKRKNKKRSQRGRRAQSGCDDDKDDDNVDHDATDVVLAASIPSGAVSCDYRIPKRTRR